MLSRNIFYLFFPFPDNFIKIFYLELKFIIMRVVVYEKNCRAFKNFFILYLYMYPYLFRLIYYIQITSLPVSPSFFSNRCIIARDRRTLFDCTFLISSNKGKARRGVTDGGPDDDGDYATLRELPLINSMDPAEDTTSEENKVSSNLIT